MTNPYRTFATLFTAGVLLACSAVPALAHRGRVFGSSFGSPGSGAGQLSLTSFLSGTLVVGGSGLAVAEVTGDVYIADTGNNRVDEFTSAGVFVRAWGWGVVNGASELQVCTEATGCRAGSAGAGPGQFNVPAFVAVDDSPAGKGNVYIADYYEGEGPENRVQKFTAEGSLIESWGSKGQINGASTSVNFALIGGIAVTPAGSLLIGSGQGFDEFDGSSGAYIERVGQPGGEASLEGPSGFAIDGAGNFYYDIPANFSVLRFKTAIKELDRLWDINTFFTGLSVSKAGELYLDEGDAIQVIPSSCVSLCSPSTTFTSPLLTKGVGLAVDSQHERVYIAEAAGDEIESIIPEPPAAPLVEAGSETVSNVSGDSATLEAVVSPRSEPTEEPTNYRFQYTTDEHFQREGFTDASSIPVPDGQLAPNYEADFVAAHPQELAPDTLYHYRVVAENEISRKEGKPTEGERNGAGGEIVRTFTTQVPGVFSLLDDRAWELVSPANKHGAVIELSMAQVSPEGNAFAYSTNAPTEAGASGAPRFTQVLSTRAGGSWDSQDISTPYDVANGLANPEFPFFSSDLSLAVVQPFGAFIPSLSAEASEQTPYLRTEYTSGNREVPCSNACYRPLVTGAPDFANVPEGTQFGAGDAPECRKTQCGPEFLGASPDGSHIVLKSGPALTEGAPAGSLYEWAEGQLQLVSVLPEGEPAPANSSQLGGRVKGGISENVRDGAVSEDGSRIVWSTEKGEGANHLYMRDVAREETVELGGTGATFQGANLDGSRVFFTEKGSLFIFEVSTDGALSTGHLSDLTLGGGMTETILGISQNGSSVYFVADTVLTSTPSPRGETAKPGQPNLYVYRAGTAKLVSVLSDDDAPDWSSSGGGSRSMTTTRVSSNGLWLAFMSDRSLTGYDNHDATGGVSDEEVFLYGAAGDNGEGSLVCASCDPTGARPHGAHRAGASTIDILLVDGQEVWGERWLAANIPAWTSALYQSRPLSDSGRLFFNSGDALVPSDTNGTEDVYEYEPQGTGSCSNGSLTFSTGSGGCLDLISSGTAREESAFLDASENGDDVFFVTSAQLLPQDTDTARDVYDARVDGGFPVPQPPPACEGDACQSPVAAPNDPTPGSLTYSGPGNPVPLLTPSNVVQKKGIKCSKGKRLSRGKCVKSKSKKKTRKAHKAAKTVQAGKTRRAGS